MGQHSSSHTSLQSSPQLLRHSESQRISTKQNKTQLTMNLDEKKSLFVKQLQLNHNQTISQTERRNIRKLTRNSLGSSSAKCIQSEKNLSWQKFGINAIETQILEKRSQALQNIEEQPTRSSQNQIFTQQSLAKDRVNLFSQLIQWLQENKDIASEWTDPVYFQVLSSSSMMSKAVTMTLQPESNDNYLSRLNNNGLHQSRSNGREDTSSSNQQLLNRKSQAYASVHESENQTKKTTDVSNTSSNLSTETQKEERDKLIVKKMLESLLFGKQPINENFNVTKRGGTSKSPKVQLPTNHLQNKIDQEQDRNQSQSLATKASRVNNNHKIRVTEMPKQISQTPKVSKMQTSAFSFGQEEKQDSPSTKCSTPRYCQENPHRNLQLPSSAKKFDLYPTQSIQHPICRLIKFFCKLLQQIYRPKIEQLSKLKPSVSQQIHQAFTQDIQDFLRATLNTFKFFYKSSLPFSESQKISNSAVEGITTILFQELEQGDNVFDMLVKSNNYACRARFNQTKQLREQQETYLAAASVRQIIKNINSPSLASLSSESESNLGNKGCFNSKAKKSQNTSGITKSSSQQTLSQTNQETSCKGQQSHAAKFQNKNSTEIRKNILVYSNLIRKFKRMVLLQKDPRLLMRSLIKLISEELPIYVQAFQRLQTKLKHLEIAGDQNRNLQLDFELMLQEEVKALKQNQPMLTNMVIRDYFKQNDSILQEEQIQFNSYSLEDNVDFQTIQKASLVYILIQSQTASQMPVLLSIIKEYTLESRLQEFKAVYDQIENALDFIQHNQSNSGFITTTEEDQDNDDSPQVVEVEELNSLIDTEFSFGDKFQKKKHQSQFVKKRTPEFDAAAQN